jgi:hypothetical protein
VLWLPVEMVVGAGWGAEDYSKRLPP